MESLSHKWLYPDIIPKSEFIQEVKFVKGNIRDYYAIECVKKDRQAMSNKIWDQFVDAIQNRAGDDLLEIYSLTSNGIHFIIYKYPEESSNPYSGDI